MSCRPLLALPLLFAASGCAQVLGSVRDTTVIDLFPSTALKESCAVTLMERAGGGVALGDASLREIPQRKGHEFAGLVEVGRLRVDGPTWLVREGASHALILDGEETCSVYGCFFGNCLAGDQRADFDDSFDVSPGCVCRCCRGAGASWPGSMRSRRRRGR